MIHHNPWFKALLMTALAAAGPITSAAAPAKYPPLSTEISAEHPLFIFEYTAGVSGPPDVYAHQVIDAYALLPESFKPFSVMRVDAGGGPANKRHAYYQALLPPLQSAGIPVVIRVADTASTTRYTPAQLEELLRAYTIVRGLEATGLAFNIYDPQILDVQGMTPNARWLVDMIDTAARYGRFLYLPLDKLDWPRIMANTDCASLYAKIATCKDYVIPAVLHRGTHNIARMSALLGFWLEGAVTQWGIAADSRWYTDAEFISPGVFGVTGNTDQIPSSIYRAMILNGAMTGATVYSFAPESDLWFGSARRHWDAAIMPTLAELLERGFIARKDFVQKKTPVACQLVPAYTPADFHINLRDIDGGIDRGYLVHGAYGMERPGQVPELILNRGDHFWVPLVSAQASGDALARFSNVVKAGTFASAQEWTQLLDQHRNADSTGNAFVAVVGRGIFIMNTRENVIEPQSFSLAEAPAPVRKITARRENNLVTLTWPFREGDVSYSVHKRILPEQRYVRLVEGLLDRSYTDASVDADQTVCYSVSALTNEKEPFSGTVNYGEYLTLSGVESRLAEEVLISPLLSVAESVPLGAGETTPASEPPAPAPWWPNYEGLDESQQALARAIIERIEIWDRAFTAEDLDGVLDIYATDYKDPQDWGFQYVRATYQWFFDCYDAPHMRRQIRRWNFSAYPDAGQISVLMYCRLGANAPADSTGRVADIPVVLPRTGAAEVWCTFAIRDGLWRLVTTNPPLPELRGHNT